jgi:hypothetical protein
LAFLLLFSFCLGWFSFLSSDALAGSFADCLETKLYWQPLSERFSFYVDVSHFDNAALSLSSGKSYGRNTGTLHGDAGSSASAFLAASYEWDAFIPRFQARLKEVSLGKAELIPISAEEAGGDSARSDVRYFKLVRRMARGVSESVVRLTRDEIKVLKKAADGSSTKTQAATQKRVDPRSLARAARRLGAAPAIKGTSPEYAKAAFEDAQVFWAPVFKKLETSSKIGGAANLEAVDARHFDAAVVAIDHGKSYSASTLKEQNYEDESARSAFHRVLNDWDSFVPKFQERLKRISKGKSELIPISSKQAGVGVSGYGLFFKLVRQTYRGPQEDIVWLTSEGFDVLAQPKPPR